MYLFNRLTGRARKFVTPHLYNVAKEVIVMGEEEKLAVEEHLFWIVALIMMLGFAIFITLAGPPVMA